jgi:hypothetical protein
VKWAECSAVAWAEYWAELSVSRSVVRWVDALVCAPELSVLLLECRSDLMTALKWVDY